MLRLLVLRLLLVVLLMVLLLPVRVVAALLTSLPLLIAMLTPSSPTTSPSSTHVTIVLLTPSAPPSLVLPALPPARPLMRGARTLLVRGVLLLLRLLVVHHHEILVLLLLPQEVLLILLLLHVGRHHRESPGPKAPSRHSSHLHSHLPPALRLGGEDAKGVQEEPRVALRRDEARCVPPLGKGADLDHVARRRKAREALANLHLRKSVQSRSNQRLEGRGAARYLCTSRLE